MDFAFLGNFTNRLGYTGILVDSNLSFELFKLKNDVAAIKHDVLLTLVTIDVNNRNDYLDYIIVELGNSYELEPDISSVEKWLKKYNVTIEDVLNETIINGQFKKIISTKFEYYTTSDELEEINLIQSDFFLYFSKLFGYDLIEFLKNKKIKSENFNKNLNTNDAGKIKWIGKPSQLGFIIGKLVELGYIEAPERKTGDVNYTRFAEIVKTTFDVETTEGTLSKYLNLESEKGQETERKFNDNSFNIPHIKEVS